MELLAIFSLVVGISLFICMIVSARSKGRSWTWALLPGFISQISSCTLGLAGAEQSVVAVMALLCSVTGMVIVFTLPSRTSHLDKFKEEFAADEAHAKLRSQMNAVTTPLAPAENIDLRAPLSSETTAPRHEPAEGAAAAGAGSNQTVQS